MFLGISNQLHGHHFWKNSAGRLKEVGFSNVPKGWPLNVDESVGSFLGQWQSLDELGSLNLLYISASKKPTKTANGGNSSRLFGGTLVHPTMRIVDGFSDGDWQFFGEYSHCTRPKPITDRVRKMLFPFLIWPMCGFRVRVRKCTLWLFNI